MSGTTGLVAVALETGASPLTARESDVLRAAADGSSTEQIGTALRLSPTTVRNYLTMVAEVSVSADADRSLGQGPTAGR